ncbi:hypothetical protein L3X38_012452 [Prunus dulcis]|uniref:Uncharacterized protein n=1 Tax=Prunus dulcis TaxID=3755 RepID=A0AAD4ZG16_PRUDU|nr:hypothetical protein L3X38_012452 [Prunus dulcis]
MGDHPGKLLRELPRTKPCGLAQSGQYRVTAEPVRGVTSLGSDHGRARDRSRSTRLVAPTKTYPFSPSETTNSGRELDWFEPELSRRRAAASATQTR